MPEQIIFHRPTIDDAGWVNSILAEHPTRCCDYNFTTLYAWQTTFDTNIAAVCNCLVARYTIPDLGERYLFPLGSPQDVLSAVMLLKEHCLSAGRQLTLVCVTAQNEDFLNRHFPGIFTFKEDRNGMEYLYETESMVTMSGRHLSGKRNHMKHFLAKQHEWTTEPISQDNIRECIEMESGWRFKEAHEDSGFLDDDSSAFIRCMESYDALNMEGMLIRCQGTIAALAAGIIIPGSDTFDLHFEKARRDVTGAYPMIASEFAKYIHEKHPEIRYINREDDMGLEGLRRSKLSYHPQMFITKLSASARPASTVRRGCSADMPQIRSIWQDAFGDTPAEINMFFRKLISPSDMIVAEAGGTIASQCALIACELVHFDSEDSDMPRSCPAFYLYAMATRSDLRGQGFGSELLKAVSDIAGKTPIITCPASEELFSFYEASGFRPFRGLSAGDMSTGSVFREASIAEYADKRNKLLEHAAITDKKIAYINMPEEFYELFKDFGGKLYVSDESVKAAGYPSGDQEKVAESLSWDPLEGSEYGMILPGDNNFDRYLIHMGIRLE